ncbi:MAG: CheR family methyltransferase [Actinomycetes bacterium]
MTKADPGFEQLLQFLKENRGFDFTGYKRASLMRRMGRAMQAAGVETYADYEDYLELHPEAFTTLFNTILINVTSFFRDAEAWQALRDEIVPAVLRDRPTGPIRVWSAGCASGEEPYSLAILLADLLGADEFRDRVKIYATDVDEEALAQARLGTYESRQLTGLSPQQVDGYFEQVNGAYVFRKDLRRCVIFGRNDLVQDAPISRIDLLACRNTLMYFNAEEQGRILRRLHFAANPRGVLFLGKAEILLTQDAIFEPLDLKRRFFRKVLGARQQPGVPPGAAGQPRTPPFSGAQHVREAALVSSPVAQVVIDRDGKVALVNQRAESLFGVSARDAGRTFQDLELSYRPVELRPFITEAMTERRPVWVRGAELARPSGEIIHLDVQLLPLIDPGGVPLGVSVFFNDVSRYQRLQEELEYANRQLETAYEELQSTNEELETTNEELQSTVEELETTNEELQSTNEELETMNEELQSMNDELQSSNDELRVRTSEISDLNGFMESILASMRGAVAVVNRNLEIQVWNQQAEEMWGLRPDEAVGQHLLNLDIGLPVERVRPLVWRMLGDESGPERRTSASADGSADGDWDTMELESINRRGRPIRVRVRASPLQGANHTVTGAILVIDQVPEPG